MQKKILMLGGNHFQTTAIKKARELGYYVISCDYLPDNPGHLYSDEYYNISTIDKESVLKLARKLKIDGILSYASDVSASTVAYVSEKMGLPGNPLSSVEILTNKGKFRQFLKENGFNTPSSKMFTETECFTAQKYLKTINLPVMIKPVDSSGSKGITKLSDYNDFMNAFEFAMNFSTSKTIVIEEFIERKGDMLEMEGFLVDGEVKFYCALDQHCDPQCTLFSPIGSSVPTRQPLSLQKKAKKEVEKVFKLLEMKFGSFNFEYIIDKNDRIYIMEIGPRNGGNFIPDMINYSTHVDLAEYSIKASIGENCSDIHNMPVKKNVAYYLIHSLKDGVLKDIRFDDAIKDKILKKHIYVKIGDRVKKFIDGRMGLGVIILEFKSLDEKSRMMENMNKFVEVIVNEE